MVLIVYSTSVSLPAYAHDDLPRLGGVSSLSVVQQEELGRGWLRANYYRLGPLEDVIMHDYVNNLVNRLRPGVDLAPYTLNSMVLSDRNFNAFAVPGGVLGFNLGIFLLAETEEEVASVVAHELAHISQNHFLRRIEYSRQISQGSLAALFAGLALALSGNLALAGLATYGALGLSNEQFLSLSRRFENEADSRGLAIMHENGFNIQGMTNMFSRLQALEGSERTAIYQTTHPPTRERVNNSLLLAARQRSQHPLADPIEYSLIKQRASFLDGRISGDYASMLELMDKSQFADAVTGLQSLHEENPDSLVIFATLMEALIKDDKPQDALSHIAERTRFSYDVPLLTYYQAQAHAAMNNYQLAIAQMQEFIEYYPEYPPLWEELSFYYRQLDDSYNTFRASYVHSLLIGDRDKMLANLRLAEEAAGDDEIKMAEIEETKTFYN